MPSTEEDTRDGAEQRLIAAEQRHAAAAQLRNQAREAGDVPAWIQAALDCGKALFDLEQYGLALRLLDEAIRLIEEHGQNRDLLPEALGMTGRTLQRMKRWNEVLPWYRRAADTAAEQGKAAAQLRWLLKEATACLDTKQREHGRQLLEQAIETGRHLLANGQPVAEQMAEVLMRMANLSSEERGLSDALWDETRTLLDALPPGLVHFRAAVNRALVLLERDQHWVAQTYFEEALEIGKAVGISEQERHQLRLRIAAALRRRNEPLQAAELLMAHLPKELDHRARHEFLKEAVDGFFAARAWAQMKAACEELRERRRDMTAGWRYDAQMLLSVAYRGLKQYEQSQSALDEALQRALEWGNYEGIAKARGQKAIVLLDQGRFTESVAISEALWAEGMRQPVAAMTLVRALIGANELDRAEAVALEFEAGGGDLLTIAQVRAHLVDAGRGDPQAAWYAVGVAAGRSHAVQAQALTRLMQLSAPGSEDRLEQARHRLRLMDYARMHVGDVFSDASWRAAFEEAHEFPGWLDDFVVEAQLGARDEAAIYELERFRAQTLVNLLAERAALWAGNEVGRGWLKGQMTSRWQRARYRYEALEARGASWHERRELAQEVERLSLQAFSAEGLMHVSPADQGIHFPQDLPTLLGEHGLAPGEAMLFAHLLPELDALWGVPVAAWLAETGVRRAFLSAGTELAALPLDCCGSFLGPTGPELVMLPTGATLGFTRGTRRPLPDFLLPATQKDRDQAAARIMRRPRGRTLLLVDPTRDLEFAPLEVAGVACAHRGQMIDTIDADRIDASRLAHACRQVEVLHFAGHGEFNDARPYRSGVWIGPRDDPCAIWTNGDIFSDVEAPGARLAVLSGCETGQTRLNLVSEEVSLPTAFIAAGYAAVVASRWAVDDLSATLLMGGFHRRWLTGHFTVAAALGGSRRWLRDLKRKAALELIDDLVNTVAGVLPDRDEDLRRICQSARELLQLEPARPFASPVYWASFYVAGDGAISADKSDRRMPGSVSRGRSSKRRRAAKRVFPRADDR